MRFELQRKTPSQRTQSDSLAALNKRLASLRSNTPAATAICVRHFQKVLHIQVSFEAVHRHEKNKQII
jgi:hypothetical protein